MNNISTIKTLVHCFLLSLFIFIMSTIASFAEDLQSENKSNFIKQQITALESAIVDYKKIAENGGWPIFKIGVTIKPDEKDERIPTLRKILSVMGDYKGNVDQDYDILDAELGEAVKHFQERHGLETDGAVGAKTGAALAVSVEYRIAQMQAAIEEMQKIQENEERFILVNIPAFYLKAIDKNTPALTSRVIIGTPKNSTPIFDSKITNIVFNPDWHVPYSIARNEFMEKLRLEPEYFSKGDYIITDNDGEEVDASEIDWENQSGDVFTFVQTAGITNALGKVKFNLVNSNGIYLHSTGSPRLFAKPYRSLSHGCIRVEKARELISFVMGGMKGWDEERISNFYDSDDTKTILITPVKVHIVYWTSWVDENSRKPQFYNDIYGKDKKRVAELVAEMKAVSK